MTKLFIDTEFNGFGGELISLAIVDEYDNEFYEVLPIQAEYDPWVAEHVVPILKKDAIPIEAFHRILYNYLSKYNNDFTIIADWPDDIRYFCQALITAPGEMLPIAGFKTEMRRDLWLIKSEVPHNALHDAIAIKKTYQQVSR